MAHNYEIGTRAWQPDQTEGWVASEVKEKKVAGDKVTLVFELANGEVRTSIGRISPDLTDVCVCVCRARPWRLRSLPCMMTAILRCRR